MLLGLNSSVVAVALVPIARDLGAAASIPWIVSGLYLAAAIGSSVGGRLADLYGPRRVYLVGVVVVILASLAGPFVRDVNALVAVRVLLGLGASVQFPAAMAIIRRQAAARQAEPVGTISVIALCGQSTAAVGPTVGGLVVAALDWQGIFWVNVPVALNALLWVWWTVPRDEPRPRQRLGAAVRRLDPLGLLLFALTLWAVMTWLLSLNARPSWWVLAALVPSLLLLLWWEGRASQPFVDVRLLTEHRQLSATCGRAISTFVAFYCVFYGLPQWLQDARGFSPATAGLLMLPVFAVGVASTALAARLGRRVAPRVLLTAGTAGMLVAGLLLATAVSTDGPLWVVVLANALLGVPTGFNNIGNQLMLHRAAPKAAAGAASGLYRTAQYVGAALSAVVVAHSLRASAPQGGITQVGLWIAGLGAALAIANGIAVARERRQRGKL